MDAKAKVVAWQYRWAGELPDGRSAEWHDCSEASFNEKTHEAMGYEYRALVPESALAELAEQVETWKGNWLRMKEDRTSREVQLTTLLSGLDALAGEWDRTKGGDGMECAEELRTLASAGLEGKGNG